MDKTGDAMKKLLLFCLLILMLVACQVDTAVPAPTPTTATVAELVEADVPAAEDDAWPLYQFEKHGVAVTVSLQKGVDGAYQLIGHFVPEDPSMHLYGMLLPKEGIDGVGRPTLLETQSDGLVANGALTADVEPSDKYFPGFEEPFPLLPGRTCAVDFTN